MHHPVKDPFTGAEADLLQDPERAAKDLLKVIGTIGGQQRSAAGGHGSYLGIVRTWEFQDKTTAAQGEEIGLPIQGNKRGEG